MYPHKEICKLLCKLMRLAGGMGVINEGTSSHSTVYDDARAVSARWVAADIPAQQLYYLKRWFTLFYEPAYISDYKQTVGPGYDDYAGKVEEMVRSGTVLKTPGVCYVFLKFTSVLMHTMGQLNV